MVQTGIQHVEWLTAAEEMLGVTFNVTDLLAQALTHPSFTNESLGNQESYQRLEFLGDAVLRLATSSLLFTLFPLEREGVLTRLCSELTRDDTIAELARHLHIGELMRFGRGEAVSGSGKKSNLAAAFEAVIGAIFLDHGYQAATDFIERELTPILPDAMNRIVEPKDMLQRITQEHFNVRPRYNTDVAEVGFVSEVSVEDRVIGVGEGGRKVTAEQAAATNAIAYLQAELSLQDG